MSLLEVHNLHHNMNIGSSSLTSVHFRSLMWVGPSLLYSTATSVLVLGWDGIARPLVTIGTPNAGKSYTSHGSVVVSSFNNISELSREILK
jgi:hypothetical protein